MSQHKIAELNTALNDTKKIMAKNIDHILDRGEKLASLEDKADELNRNANTFKTNSGRLKHKYMCENAKLIGVIICIVVILVLAIIASICGSGHCH
jgi:vesicle-associated membrane protein 4